MISIAKTFNSIYDLKKSLSNYKKFFLLGEYIEAASNFYLFEVTSEYGFFGIGVSTSNWGVAPECVQKENKLLCRFDKYISCIFLDRNEYKLMELESIVFNIFIRNENIFALYETGVVIIDSYFDIIKNISTDIIVDWKFDKNKNLLSIFEMGSYEPIVINISEYA